MIDLDFAYQEFFIRLKNGEKPGFPKFKSKHKTKPSFRIIISATDEYFIKNNRIKVPKIGWIRLKEWNYIPVTPTENIKHISLTENGVLLLKKRAYCYKDIDEFCNALSLYFKGNLVDQKPDVNNVEFLEGYGIMKNDGKVVERVMNVLNNLIK